MKNLNSISKLGNTLVIIIIICFSFPALCLAQADSLVKFKGLKTWELQTSPTDLHYKFVPNWLKIPAAYKPKVVSDVAVDSRDNIFVVDRDSVASIICLNTIGEFQYQWKPKGFGAPHFIHCDKNDDLWVTDIKTHQIHKINNKGEIVMSLGVKGVKGSDGEHFDKPTDIDFLKDGSVLVSDGYGANKRIVKLDAQFKFIKEWGKKGELPGEFAVPHQITVASDGKIYVADRDAWRIQIFDKDGTLLEVWPHIGRVFDIIETRKHNFLCLDATTGRITEVDNKGNLIGFFGNKEELFDAHGFAMTSDEDIIVAMKDGRVQKYVLK